MRLKFILFPDSSLLFLSKKRIKETQPLIYDSQRQANVSKLKGSLSSRNSFVLIFPLVFMASLLCMVDYGLFAREITANPLCLAAKRDFIDKLIDNRINNIVTLTSISLVVVGWLINNIKEKTKETYEILFSATKLYPIVYFILSVICFLIFLSAIRYRLKDTTYINSMIYGLILIFMSIFFIGYLFRMLIRFSDSSYLNELSSKSLANSIRQVLYQEQIVWKSKEIIEETFSNYGNIIDNPFLSRFPNQVNLLSQKPKKIADMDVKAVEGCIKNLFPPDTTNHLDFYSFSIGENVSENFPRTVMFVSNQVFQVNTLSAALNQYVLLEDDYDKVDLNKIKKSLFEKAEESIKNKDTKTLDLNLKDYELIYEFYFNTFHA